MAQSYIATSSGDHHYGRPSTSLPKDITNDARGQNIGPSPQSFKETFSFAQASLKYNISSTETATASPPTYHDSNAQVLLQRLRTQSIFTEVDGVRDELPNGNKYDDTHYQDEQSARTQAHEKPTGLNNNESQRTDALAVQINDIVSPTKGTCEWINSRPEYIKWRQSGDSNSRVLVVLANAGLGKSVLAKSIATNLTKDGVMAFFCKKGLRGRESTSSVIATFLHRLLSQDKTLSQYITDPVTDSADDLSFEQLWSLFAAFTQDPMVQNCTFIIDALDECDNRSQQWLLKSFLDPQFRLGSRLLITARAERYPASLGRRFPCLPMEADTVSADITTFINSMLRSRGYEDLYNHEMIELLKENMNSETQGMFLRVAIMVDEFDESREDASFSTSPDSLKRFFNRPSGRLGDYYRDMLNNATAHLNPGSRTMAADILNLLLAFQITASENTLRAAYAFSHSSYHTYTEFLGQSESNIIERAKRLCGPITRHRLEDDTGRSTLSIIHPTAREFLETYVPSVSMDPISKFLATIKHQIGHGLMAKACLSILLLPEVINLGRRPFENFPFLVYAVLFLHLHIRESKESFTGYVDVLREFFTGKLDAYQSWSILYAYLTADEVPTLAPPVIITFVDQDLDHMIAGISREKGGSNSFLGQPIDINAANEKGDTALLITICCGRSDTAMKLLELGASPHISNIDGLTPLHAAISLELNDTISSLVRKGASLDAEMRVKGGYQDRNGGMSPLFYALSSLSTFDQVIQLGASKFCRTIDRWSILHEAALNANLPMVMHILEQRLIADVDSTTIDGVTALHAAAGIGRSLPIVKYLIEMHSASPDKTSDSGLNALYEAASNNNLDIVLYLLPKTADKDAIQSTWAPLHVAADKGYCDIVKALIEGGVNLERLNDVGATALFWAVQESHTDVAHVLIEAMQDVDCHGGECQTPLFRACVTGNVAIANKLLSKNANSRLPIGKITCLHIAAWLGDVEVVKALIGARAPDNDVDEVEPNSGWTPLLSAISKGHTGVAKCLILAGADTKVTSSFGSNALHFASQRTHDSDLFRSLVNTTSREHALAKNGDGATPLHEAARNGFSEAVDMLLDLDGDPVDRDESLSTPLFLAAANGHSDILKQFLNMEIDFLPDLQTADGWTVLHAVVGRCELPLIRTLVQDTNWRCRKPSVPTPMGIAAARGDPEVVDLLVKMGMPVNFSSNTGWTALHEAALRGNEKLVSILLEHGADSSRLDSGNTTPLSWAYDSINDTLIQQLQTLNTSAGAKAFYSLSSCVHYAASISPASVQRLVDLGLSVDCQDAEMLAPLHWAASWNNPDALQYLLEQPGVIDRINVKSHLIGTTPLLTAARFCNVECMERLLDAGADPTTRDIYGNNAFDYARQDKESFLTLFFGSDKSSAFAIHESLEEKKKRMIFLICEATDWIQRMRDQRKAPWYEIDKAIVLTIMYDAFLFLHDTANSATAMEIKIGPPSSSTERMSWNCRHCSQRTRPPYQVCLTCLGRHMCQACKDKTEKERVKGCHKHQFMEIPRPSWCTRGKDQVTDDNLSEVQWLQHLKDKYQSQKDPALRFAGLSVPIGNQNVVRPSVFDICRLSTMDSLQIHLDLYPRDVALRDSAGASLAMVSIEISTSDEDALRRLQCLRLHGCRLLSWDNAGTSTVRLACQKRYAQSLVFLLNQFDPEFGEFNDPSAMDTVQTMVSKRWRPALLAAVERHFDWVARGKFAWLHDLQLLGLTETEITDLLINSQECTSDSQSQVDGSWSKLVQPPSSRKPLPDKHREHCACKMETEVANKRGEYRGRADEAETKLDSLSSSSESTSTYDMISAMCGLAGTFPTNSENVRFGSPTNEDTSVSIAYSGSPEHYYKASLETVLKAGTGLLEAMRSAQDASLCCDGFSILHYKEPTAEDNLQPTVELLHLRFEDITTLAKAIEDVAGTSGSAASQDDPRLRVVDNIATKLHLDFNNSGLNTNTFVDDLDRSCLMIQVLCLGFSLYLNGHLYRCRLPFSETKITSFALRGLGHERCITFQALDLACVGDMLGDQVFAFSKSHEREQMGASKQLAKRCGLLARPVDIIDLWGPAQCIVGSGSVEPLAKDLRAVELLDGHFALDGGERNGTKTAHWSPTPYSGLPGIEYFTIDQWILLGTLPHNNKCQFNMSEAWARANDSFLVRLDTRSSFWALANRQLSIGFNAIYVNGGMVGQQQKYSKWSSKLSVMTEWSNQHSRALTLPWGMLFSVCTGFARRVPLREAVGQVFYTYLDGNDLAGPNGETPPPDWTSTKSIIEKKLKGDAEKSDEVNNAAFDDYYNQLSHLNKNHVHAAISFVLQYLKQTGVDSAGTSFKVAWADPLDPFQAFEFPCSGDAGWTRILEDSRRTATFAVATSSCLVTHMFRSPFAATASCRCYNETAVDPIPLRLVETKLLPYNLKGSALTNWSLSCSTSYSFLVESSTNRLCVLKEVGRWRSCRRFLLIMSSWTDMPWQLRQEIRRLLNKEEVVRESHQPYTHSGPGGPQPAIICSMLQWRKENNMSGG